MQSNFAGSCFTVDQNPALFLYLSHKDLIPEYVMKSARISTEDLQDLSDAAFADPDNQQLPVHTKEACWLSAAYCAGNGYGEGTIKDTIVKMATVHDISDEVAGLFSVFDAEFEKIASSPADEVTMADGSIATPLQKFAVMIDFEGYNGRALEGFYPINNTVDVMLAASDLTSDYNAGKVPDFAMREASVEIIKAAALHNVDHSELTQGVIDMGTPRLPDVEAARLLVQDRALGHAKMATYMEVFDKLDVDINVKNASVQQILAAGDEAAQLVSALDGEYGIVNSIRRPKYRSSYEVVFSGPKVEDLYKAAASTVPINGIRVPATDILNVTDTILDTMFSRENATIIKNANAQLEGDLTIDKCVAAADTIATLSEDSRKIYLSVLAEVGW